MYGRLYVFEKLRIDRPQIVAVTNGLLVPDFELMSQDRWKVYKICQDTTVIQWNIQDCIVAQAVWWRAPHLHLQHILATFGWMSLAKSGHMD